MQETIKTASLKKTGLFQKIMTGWDGLMNFRPQIILVLITLFVSADLYASGKLYKFNNIIGKGRTRRNYHKPGFFYYPQSVAIDGKGNIYVVDRDNNRIQAFRPNGKHYMTIGKPWRIANGKNKPDDFGPYILRHPYGVAIDKNSIYVTDWAKHRIIRYDLKGKYLGEWGGETGKSRALNHPCAIFVDHNGRIIVGCEYNNYKGCPNPYIYDSKGKFLGSLPFHGTYGFVETPDGSLFQTYQNRIYKISKDGKLIGWIGRAHLPLEKHKAAKPGGWIPASMSYPNGPEGGYWDSPGSGKSEFREPRALAVDPQRKRLFVCDMMNHRVQVFNLDGKYLGEIGKRGSKDGEFLCPTGVAVDKNGKVYVADKYNNRVQVFAPVK